MPAFSLESETRTGCANERPSGSVRGVPGDWHPYRDRQVSIESTIGAILKRTMLPWSVHAYIRVLFALELLLFVASVSLHGAVLFIGATEHFVQYSEILSRAAVLICMLVFAFIKDGLRWLEQIKV